MDELRKAIKRTEKYGKKYGGWTPKQVKERLISAKTLEIRDLTEKKVTNKHYIQKMKKAKELVKKYFSKMTDVLMVGVTGSVAAENPGPNDDIDLMIITKSNKLWLSRIKWWLETNRQEIPHRKPMVEGKSDEFCFNLWLDEEALEIPKTKQNLRNGMDLILMKPILNRNETYEKFVSANNWAERYVKNGYDRIKKDTNSNAKERTTLIEGLVNWLMFWGQYCYMRRKMRKEMVDLHRAFFHPND